MKVAVAAHFPKAFLGEQERRSGPAQEHFAAAPVLFFQGVLLCFGLFLPQQIVADLVSV